MHQLVEEIPRDEKPVIGQTLMGIWRRYIRVMRKLGESLSLGTVLIMKNDKTKLTLLVACIRLY